MSIDHRLVTQPLLFQDNRVERFYTGGKLLNEWRGMAPMEDSHACEELLVTSDGAISAGKPEGYGVSKTIPEQGGVRLDELIQAYPEEMLGARFHSFNPGQLAVLVRAGDTTVRIVMQCHLTDEKARHYFGMPRGKAEAWYIARLRGGAEERYVYAGFKPHVTPELWRELFERQDIDAMVDCLHKLPVHEGDEILIPAGMPHCMGPNCLFVEYHECNDVTIRAERVIGGQRIDDAELFHGLSADEGLGLFDYTTYDDDAIRERCVMVPRTLEETGEYRLRELIGPDRAEGFEVQAVDLTGSYVLPAFDGHRVLVAVDGDAVLAMTDGRRFELKQGHGALVPAACQGLALEGEGSRVTIGVPVVKA